MLKFFRVHSWLECRFNFFPVENEGLSLSTTEKGLEEALQLITDVLSLNDSLLVLAATQKATLELGLECC